MVSGSAIKKIFLYVILAVAFVLIGNFAYFQIFKTCGNCGGDSEFSGDYSDITIEYVKNNGSLPPPYQRKNTLTISVDGSGGISGEYVTRDYEKVLESVGVSVSNEQLKNLMLLSAESGRRTDGVGDPVCPGAWIKSVQIFQGDTLLYNRSLASCGGAPTDAALTEIFKELEELVP